MEGLDQKLTARKKQLRITFDELSRRSGIAVSTLKKLLGGITKEPELETVRAIAHAMGMSLDELIPKQDEPSNQREDGQMLPPWEIASSGINDSKPQRENPCSMSLFEMNDCQSERGMKRMNSNQMQGAERSNQPMTANEIIAKLAEEVGHLKAQLEIAELKQRIAELEAQVARKS